MHNREPEVGELENAIRRHQQIGLNVAIRLVDVVRT
jgi:hypothetical protein